MAKGDVIDVLIAEAVGEGDEGLAAVAWTIMNRAAETGRTPAQVVSDPGDYTGASNPGPATKKAMKDPAVRAKVEKVWSQVQSGSIPDPTGGATHYWAPNGMKGGKAPYWAKSETSAAGRLQIGNHVFLPKQTPNSALAAINAAAPTPMPSRPAALGYTQNTATPSLPAPRSYAPPGMKALSEGNAAFGVLPFDKRPDPSTYAPGLGIDLKARDLNPPIVPRVPAPPARGVGTSYLAPATKVSTYKVDNLGNPIISGAREPLPSERVIPSAVPKLMQQANAAAAVAPKMAQPVVMPPVLTAAQRSALASTGSTTPSVAPVPRTRPTFPVAVAQNGTYTPAPAPVNLLAKADQSRLPTGTYDPGGDAIMAALYPRSATPPAVSAINAATAPRLPRMPTAAMSAARLPTVPVRTAPVPAARVPLTQFNTVNPMTQIVPAVQARAGQGLIGRIFNMATAGNVPQANTALPGAPTNRPAWQNNPNVQRDDKWAGVLDNFGMII